MSPREVQPPGTGSRSNLIIVYTFVENFVFYVVVAAQLCAWLFAVHTTSPNKLATIE